MAMNLDIEALLKELFSSKDNTSLLKQCLTPAMAEKYKKLKTPLGCDLAVCIVSGVKHHDSSMGVYAPDTAAFELFKDFFEALLAAYNHMPVSDLNQPRLMQSLGSADLDPEGIYILSTRIRLARNLKGKPMCPIASEQDLAALEAHITKPFSTFTGTMKGQYHPMGKFDAATKKSFDESHILFHNTDSYLATAGCYRHWPVGRGVFTNADRTFVIWVNEEDHLRIISMQKGGNLGAVYDRIIDCEKKLSSTYEFGYDSKLGYHTMCPTNLGTTLRASAHIKLPKVSALKNFKDICGAVNLQVRGTGGEHTETKDGVFDISNKRRYGITENDAVSDMKRGINMLILLEKSL